MTDLVISPNPDIINLMDEFLMVLKLPKTKSPHYKKAVAIAERRLSKEWAKACAASGQEHICLQHASRHSTATEIVNEHIKKGLEAVPDQLGHNNLSTGKEHYIIQENMRGTCVDKKLPL